MSDRWFADLEARLPQHARLIGALRDAVAADERWRWFDVSCSLGAGRGDELSDIDCAIGFADPIEVDELEALGEQLVASVGDAADMLVHVAGGLAARDASFRRRIHRRTPTRSRADARAVDAGVTGR